MSLSTIVVGVDLSVPSEQAVDRAAALAKLHGGKLVLVHGQADDAPIEHTDNAMVEQLGEVSAAVRAEEAKRLGDRLVVKMRPESLDNIVEIFNLAH